MGNIKDIDWTKRKVSYRALHKRMYKLITKPEFCTFCKTKSPEQIANKSGVYSLSINDWLWLCRKCHSRYDHGWVFNKNKWLKKCCLCEQMFTVNKVNFYCRKNGKWAPNCKKCSSIINKRRRKKVSPVE